jgi:hypothetical protein
MTPSYCSICETRIGKYDRCDGCFELICDTCMVEYPVPERFDGATHLLEDHDTGGDNA